MNAGVGTGIYLTSGATSLKYHFFIVIFVFISGMQVAEWHNNKMSLVYKFIQFLSRCQSLFYEW